MRSVKMLIPSPQMKLCKVSLELICGLWVGASRLTRTVSSGAKEGQSDIGVSMAVKAVCRAQAVFLATVL